MIRINLLAEGKRPAAVRRVRSAGAPPREWGPWLAFAGILIGIVVLGGWWWALAREQATNRVAIREAQAEVERLKPIIREVEDYKRKQAELERKIDVIKRLQENQKGPVQVMDFISRALPELLWLERMTMNGNRITLTGRAFNTNAVANFIDNLDKVAEFQEPNLQDMQEQAGGVYAFTVVFNFSYPSPAAGDAAAATAAG